ncbi:MAG TPA: hypothetical protein VMZ06_17380 [Candidatus Bathyarchaeia archaeon]|nr:hypothetical protein [Candidatus Bathyarchaeia archaeon]
MRFSLLPGAVEWREFVVIECGEVSAGFDEQFDHPGLAERLNSILAGMKAQWSTDRQTGQPLPLRLP